MDSARTRRRAVLAAPLALLATAPRSRAAGAVAGSGGRVVVFAAASLVGVLETLATRWRAETAGLDPRFSFAASSTLARQIEQGAPAHLFVSADEAWMDHLQRRGFVDAATRRVVACNRLVVVRSGTPAGAAGEAPETRAAIAAALGLGTPEGGRIATGDPAHVPVGRYAEAALRALGLWAEAAARLVRTDHVRSALAFVERGEAPAAVVYASDARASRRVHVAARFPAASHPPIRYPAALLRGAPDAAARLLDRLAAPDARAAFATAGFDPP